jgi:hypothetical protein
MFTLRQATSRLNVPRPSSIQYSDTAERLTAANTLAGVFNAAANRLTQVFQTWMSVSSETPLTTTTLASPNGEITSLSPSADVLSRTRPSVG